MTIDNQIHENIIHLKKINATFPFSQKLIELDNRYLIPIIVDNKIGFINKTFEIIFEPQFENVRGNFNTSQDIVCALKEGKWGVINTNETLISFQYSYITQGIGCMLFTVGKNYKHAVLDGYENYCY